MLKLVKHGEGEHWLIGGETTTVKVSGADSEGHLLVTETRVPPRAEARNVARHDFIEAFYIAEGSFQFTTTDENGQLTTLVAHAGDCLFVPPAQWHGFRDAGDQVGRLLAIFSSDILEQMTRAVGERIVDPANPPAEPAAPAARGPRRSAGTRARPSHRLPEGLGGLPHPRPPQKIERGRRPPRRFGRARRRRACPWRR